MWSKSSGRGPVNSGRGPVSRGRRLVWVAALILMGLACFCMSGCGTDDIDISGYAEESIVLRGVTEEDITLTAADLKAMDCVTKSTESTSDKIGRVRATGPTLDTVLKQYGMTQADIRKAHIYAKDDYDVKLSPEILEKEEIILAFGIDGQPLGEEEAPVRIIIPESDSAYWIRMVERIEVGK